MVRLLVVIAALGFVVPLNAPLDAIIKRDAALKASTPIAGCAMRGQDAGPRLLAELCVSHAAAAEALLRLAECNAAPPSMLCGPAAALPRFHLRI